MAIIKVSTASEVENVLNPLIGNFAEDIQSNAANFAMKTGEIWAGKSAVNFAQLAKENLQNLYRTFSENVQRLTSAINRSIDNYSAANEEQLDRVQISSPAVSFTSLDANANIKDGATAGWVGLVHGHNMGEVLAQYDQLVDRLQEICSKAETTMLNVADEVYDDPDERNALSNAMRDLHSYVKNDFSNLRTVLEESLNAREENINAASTDTVSSYTNLTQ